MRRGPEFVYRSTVVGAIAPVLEMNAPIVLITGAYRGIGFEAARQFVARGAQVIVTSRRRVRGEAAIASLGHSAVFLELDVNDGASIVEAAKAVGVQFGRLDVLVNNTAVLLDEGGTLFDLRADVLRATLETNLVAPLRVIQAFVPLLQRSAAPRIINVASGAGQLAGGASSWAPAYSISKTALNMLTLQWSAALPGMAVNSMCPGWCRTEMGGPDAPRSPELGADTIVWLGLDAPQARTGGFYRDRALMEW